MINPYIYHGLELDSRIMCFRVNGQAWLAADL
jgi:hypothetical protein